MARYADGAKILRKRPVPAPLFILFFCVSLFHGRGFGTHEMETETRDERCSVLERYRSRRCGRFGKIPATHFEIRETDPECSSRCLFCVCVCVCVQGFPVKVGRNLLLLGVAVFFYLVLNYGTLFGLDEWDVPAEAQRKLCSKIDWKDLLGFFFLWASYDSFESVEIHWLMLQFRLLMFQKKVLSLFYWVSFFFVISMVDGFHLFYTQVGMNVPVGHCSGSSKKKWNNFKIPRIRPYL